MRYLIAPGLYRIGQPDSNSPVLVTANYKLTVDAVRRSLIGLNVWMLVLDTKGVNVWCAAGKGTFGTKELVRRIEVTNLANFVQHRRLVLPQLGAVGVAAHDVKNATGFFVHYGPVRAADISAYLAAGMRATPAMRRVTFDWKDRLTVAPMEIAGAFKPTLIIIATLALVDIIRHHRVTSQGGGNRPAVGGFATVVLTDAHRRRCGYDTSRPSNHHLHGHGVHWCHHVHEPRRSPC